MVRQVADAIESAGLGPARVLLFLGRPTMDLVVDAEEPELVERQLTSLLASFPVAVSQVGRHGDLAWFAKLWPHL